MVTFKALKNVRYEIFGMTFRLKQCHMQKKKKAKTLLS